MALDNRKEVDYNWVGRDKLGNRVEGVLKAASPTKVRSLLNAQGIQPLKIVKAKVKKGKGGKVKPDDIMLFTRQLATMLAAGLPLSEALSMQASGASKIALSELLYTVKTDVDRGGGLSNALAKHPFIFDRTYVGLVAAGERSGTLEIILAQLADFLEKSSRIKKTIKKALVYPAIVIFIALSITALILWKVVPVFADMFKEQGRELPGATQFVVNISEGIRSWGFIYTLMGIGVFIYLFKRLLRTNLKFKRKFDEVVLKLPIFGNLIVLSNSANFASTLATMYEAGTPMIAALTTVADSTSNSVFKEAIEKINANVSIGQELNFAMRQSKMFPDMVSYMVGIGEKSGNLSEMLNKVSNLYMEDIDNAVGAMMSMIEPILIVILGSLVGGIVVAMYLPLFSMAEGM
ncbi:type II secretion system F family protein [Wohlfahrtiimonas chitiniclastica]|uniref:Type 4 fimbrial assembly protein PilC n=2 Tax=Wohlfahrtiimonas chitiniclastica TaxID=400946 RepID=L8Y0W4_9GAMM|nr:MULTISPECIES: type II secretion system F family protein [Wohlfahrtiimonas]ELV08136.1 Type 4 fimbrial assembly protein PilC [Wohlfahrtiimonas chitiniclastica SH04]KZS23058.1 type 4 fimbrial assembly protein PilC [Wohlfahrtiimonas chitiniclastica]KZX37583.1 pilus assembly protein PilC [Wohlfahrtiimonas chitiniclastica]MBS7815503.1 type II secretion system F family protein [Wohlfahrtiimonas chitiniclastica]MBS7817557.1 type II secretion system F family protein [Wohlfahrtiimonas chitiniclastica